MRPSCGRAIDTEAVILEGKAAVKNLGLATTVRLQKAGCLEYCEAGPACIVYPEGVGFQIRTPADIVKIVGFVAEALREQRTIESCALLAGYDPIDISLLPVAQARPL